MHWHATDILAFKQNAPLAGLRRTAAGHKQRGFAGTVGTDQGDDFTFIDFHINALEGFDIAIEGMNTFDFKHGHIDGLPHCAFGSR